MDNSESRSWSTTVGWAKVKERERMSIVSAPRRHCSVRKKEKWQRRKGKHRGKNEEVDEASGAYTHAVQRLLFTSSTCLKRKDDRTLATLS